MSMPHKGTERPTTKQVLIPRHTDTLCLVLVRCVQGLAFQLFPSKFYIVSRPRAW